jgi:glutamate racemase
VFDSGLGGLTVLREIVGTRPDAHYVYVADDAFFPYGHHGEDQIIARVVPLIGELIAAHARSGRDRLQYRLDAGDVASS